MVAKEEKNESNGGELVFFFFFGEWFVLKKTRVRLYSWVYRWGAIDICSFFFLLCFYPICFSARSKGVKRRRTGKYRWLLFQTF